MRETRLPRGTLILPTYNAANFIDRAARRLIRFADDHPDWRVLFVCDGCEDDTVARLQALVREFEADGRIRIESYSANRGKGYALRRGLDLADTPFKVYTDVDLAYDPSEVVRLAEVLEETSADLAVVNRASPQSQFIITPRDFHNIYKRHLVSRSFNWWLRRM